MSIILFLCMYPFHPENPLRFNLKEIIIIIIIIPKILFDTEYIAFSVFGLAFLLLARQSLYKYNSVLARSSFPIISAFYVKFLIYFSF